MMVLFTSASRRSSLLLFDGMVARTEMEGLGVCKGLKDG
jgi:hypothetical protein